MNFKKNLYDLLADAFLFQYAEINDTKDSIEKKKPRFFFTKIQLALLFVSIVMAMFLIKGFSDSFAGYIISGLSLFVGLFFTFIISLYDKFNNIDFSVYHVTKNTDKHAVGVRLKNFYKKVSVLSLFSVLIAIFSIVLLSVTLLFPVMKSEVCIKLFILEVLNKNYTNILKVSTLLIYRATVLYFLFDFILITIYLISSFYDFFISEYNKVKLS